MCFDELINAMHLLLCAKQILQDPFFPETLKSKNNVCVTIRFYCEMFGWVILRDYWRHSLNAKKIKLREKTC